jgi:hypothetical protein
MTTTLPFEPCEMCVRIALGWRDPGAEGPLYEASRASAQALFGLHLHTAHPGTPAPGPDLVDCEDCRRLVSYVEMSGDDVEIEGACSISGPDVLTQHLLSHFVSQVLIADGC